MQKKVYLYLFILCAILPQGIFGKSLEDDNGESPNVLDRKKRVINRIPGEDGLSEIGDVPYIVNIRKNRGLKCVGTILSSHTFITAVGCVVGSFGSYEVFSGSAYAYRGTFHNITHRAIHTHGPSATSTLLTGIALINVAPGFRFKNTVSSIMLHEEPVLAGMIGIVSGWGNFVCGGQRESSFNRRLRSISVPIMNHQQCRNIYHGHFPIAEEDFCTYHAQKLCGHTDVGAPFVVNNKLVGVYIGGIDTSGREFPVKPDVFVLLQHPEYRQWINRTIVL